MDALHGHRGSPREVGSRRGGIGLPAWVAFVAACGLWFSTAAAAAVASDLDLEDVEKLYQTGQYDACPARPPRRWGGGSGASAGPT